MYRTLTMRLPFIKTRYSKPSHNSPSHITFQARTNKKCLLTSFACSMYATVVMHLESLFRLSLLALLWVASPNTLRWLQIHLDVYLLAQISLFSMKEDVILRLHVVTEVISKSLTKFQMIFSCVWSMYAFVSQIAVWTAGYSTVSHQQRRNLIFWRPCTWSLTSLSCSNSRIRSRATGSEIVIQLPTKKDLVNADATFGQKTPEL